MRLNPEDGDLGAGARVLRSCHRGGTRVGQPATNSNAPPVQGHAHPDKRRGSDSRSAVARSRSFQAIWSSHWSGMPDKP